MEVLAADGSSISLRQALLPLLAECLGGDGGQRVAAPGTQLKSQPSTPLARAGNGAGSMAASESIDGEAPLAAAATETSSGTDQAAAPAPAEESDKGEAGAAAAADGAPSPVDAGGVAATAAESLLDLAAAERRLLVGGASPPRDAPLAWLHAQLHAGDYLLYAVLPVPQAR